MEAEMAPYSLPSARLPIPLFALHWPGILPYFLEVKPEKGAPWMNTIEVTPSMPAMAVKATCKGLYSDHMFAHVQVTLDEAPVSAMIEKIQLTLRPSGSWVVIFEHETGQIIRSSGQVRASVDGKGPGDAAATEVLNYSSDFRFIQVPLSTADNHLLAAPWKPFLDVAPDPKIPPPDAGTVPHKH
jgi:hypothetical protein